MAKSEYPAGHGDGHIAQPAQDENGDPQDQISIFAVITDEYAPLIKKGEYVIFDRNAEPIPGWEIIVGTRIEKFDGTQTGIDGVVEGWRHPRFGDLIDGIALAAVMGIAIKRKRVQVIDMVAG